MTRRAPSWLAARARQRFRRRLLIAWAVLPVAELALLAGDPTRPTAWQVILEIGVLLVIGVTHSLAATEDWRGSAAWPGALALCTAGLRAAFAGHLPTVAVAGLAGLLLIATAALVWLDQRWGRRWIPGFAVTLLCAVAARLVGSGLPPAEAIAAPLALLETPTATAEGPPIVLISIDALRYDSAKEMRSLKRLRRHGAVWSRALAGGSWTVPSLATILTGQPTREHGADRRDDGTITGIAPQVPVLTEQLAARGYCTAAFVTNAFVDLPRIGLRRGFETFRFYFAHTAQPLLIAGDPPDAEKHGDARLVIDGALRWLETAPARGFFLWVHLFEPHLPYEHAPPTQRFGHEFLRRVRTGRLWAPDRAAVRAGYEHEVRYVDHQVLRLLDALERRGHFEDGALVLTSDHGEELWEHGGFEHGHSHHREVVDVPLALVAPGVRREWRGDLATHEDIAPTLRAVAGLSPAGYDLRDPLPEDRVATSEGALYFGPLRSLRTRQLRVIVRGERIEQYDLGADPAEQHPAPLTAAELERIEPPRGAPIDGPAVELNERLRALGYVR